MANKRKKTGKERRQKKLERFKKQKSQYSFHTNSQTNFSDMNPEEADLLKQGMNAHSNGDLFKAEECYNTILAKNPVNPQALLHIGIIHYKRNELAAADEFMTRAYENGLRDESYYINYGLVCEKLNRYKEAEECYNKAISINPKIATTYFNKGLLLYKQFKFKESIECFIKSDELEPDSWLTEFQLGCSLQECKRYDESLEYLYKAHKKQPEHARTLCAIGMSLFRKYKYAEARDYVEKALSKEPQNDIFIFNYAFILKESGEKLKAKAAFEKALEINPNNIEALLGLGRLLTELGDFDSCRELFQKAIDIKPDYYAPYASMGISYYKTSTTEALKWFNKALKINPNADDVYSLKGYALNILGNTEEAEKSLRKAIELRENHAEYHQNLGNVLMVQAKIPEALEHCQKSIELNPNSSLAFSNLLLYMHYIPQSTKEDIWNLHKIYSKLFEPKDLELRPYLSEPRKNRKIRIGLVSSDFRKHSVAYFIEPLLNQKDTRNYEYYTYANVKVPDIFSQRIANLSTKWQSILQLSDVQAAELIRNDQIDILIDLGGHTADNRLKLFCLKPAPIQVSWLGYPDTTGLNAIDYRIADEYTEPEGAENFSSEKIIRLPGGFHCYSALADSPDVVPPPSTKNGYVTFGSFNNFAKCSNETIFLWSEIMKNVPNSKIILKALSLGDKYVQEYAYNTFKNFGIERERITMLARTSSLKEHFENYNNIDIALDTYPYNGTTTSCEAMWMGVPIVSFFGVNHASRVGLSLLSHIGLQQLAAGSPEEFVNKAVALANEEELRTELRSTMRQRLSNSPILNAEHFARKFEAAMSAIWNVYCENPTGKHEPEAMNIKSASLTDNSSPNNPAARGFILNQPLQPQPNQSISLNFDFNAPEEKAKDQNNNTKPSDEGLKLNF